MAGDLIPMTYRGMSRGGRSRIGSISKGTPAELAERLFNRGYRWLSITRGGIEVGGIKMDRQTGRVWWGESK